jgi:hypothetical protein
MLAFITSKHLTENVRKLAQVCKSQPDKLPILADALEEAGCPDEPTGYGCRGILTALRNGDCFSVGLQNVLSFLSKSSEERYAEKFRKTAFARCGVRGCVDSVATLMDGITRKRPRGSGSRRELAQRLADRLNELAARRWERVCKGQRKPTPKQAAEFVERLTDAVDTANGRCKERTIDTFAVIDCGRSANAEGYGSVDGGKVTASSYKYRWTTTEATASRNPDGTITATVFRDGRRSQVTAPAKWWKDVTTSSSTLRLPGAVFGIRDGDGWKVYNADCELIGVAVPMPADLKAEYGSWEHGSDRQTCEAEIEHKRRTLAEKREQAERSAREKAKAERRANLLMRVAKKLTVTYQDARACGMCDAGIRSFAARIGVTDVEQAVPLAEVARLEPAYALKLARHILQKVGR